MCGWGRLRFWIKRKSLYCGEPTRFMHLRSECPPLFSNPTPHTKYIFFEQDAPSTGQETAFPCWGHDPFANSTSSTIIQNRYTAGLWRKEHTLNAPQKRYTAGLLESNCLLVNPLTKCSMPHICAILIDRGGKLLTCAMDRLANSHFQIIRYCQYL